MRLVTYASPTHKEMCQRFVIDRAESAGFERYEAISQSEQYSESGAYGSDGFNRACWEKIRALSKIDIGESVCYVDADCLILPGLRTWCESWLRYQPDNAIGFGDDRTQLCCGTMVWRQTQRTKDWFYLVYQIAQIINRHDQTATNDLISQAVNLPIVPRVLPPGVFANLMSLPHGDMTEWNGESLEVPNATLCWHANFCIGVERKIEMLEMVEANILQRFGTAAIVKS